MKHKDRILFARSVSDTELGLLYKSAAVVASPSHFEGGVQQPVIEGIYWNTPVVATALPATIERLEFHNINTSDLLLYPKGDVLELTNMIKFAIENREVVVKRQRPMYEKLLSYNWEDCATKMLNIIDKTVSKATGYNS